MFDQAGDVVGTLAQRRHADGDHGQVFAEMPKGSPEAIKAWFYPGDTVGDELMYPATEAPKVAAAIEQTVVAQTRG